MPRRNLIREIYAGSEQILRRLRAAKRPEILVPLEIPSEEMDIEPDTIDLHAALLPIMEEIPIDDLPALPLDHTPAAQRPARLAAIEIIPDDEDDET